MHQVSTIPADGPISHVPAVARLPIFEPGAMQHALSIAEAMSKAPGLVPQFMLNNPGVCLAVTIQALNWRLDPFSVAKEAWVEPKSGRLNYTARTYASAAQALGALRGDLDFENLGDWDRIRGRFDKSEPTKPKRLWSDEDERGLAVSCIGTLARSGKTVEKTVYLADIAIRNSPLWHTEPAQQLSYQACVRWIRLYAPAVLMGVNLGGNDNPNMRDMGEAQQVPRTDEERREALDAALSPIKARVTGERLPSLPEVLTHIQMADTMAALERCIQMAQRLPTEIDKATARQAYREKNAALKGPSTSAPAPERAPDPVATEAPENSPRTNANAPVFTYAEVRHQLEHAETVEALDDAANLIGGVENAEHREELAALYHSLRGE
jgi:hypothetical protein